MSMVCILENGWGKKGSSPGIDIHHVVINGRQIYLLDNTNISSNLLDAEVANAYVHHVRPSHGSAGFFTCCRQLFDSNSFESLLKCSRLATAQLSLSTKACQDVPGLGRQTGSTVR